MTCGSVVTLQSVRKKPKKGIKEEYMQEYMLEALKEANAAAMRIANNLTTQEQEASEYNGNNFDEIMNQRKKEVAMQRELADAAGLPTTTKQDDPEEDGEEEEK